ncbi:MAG: hypothetical protein HC881_12685 [Leptolyngbyaceae cyanobacterium SL_7_1]|nr:hypothetical protein [Leptolyngbyaceae cyanobacterium SL_7_1]
MKLPILTIALVATSIVGWNGAIATSQELNPIDPQSRPITDPLDASPCYMVTLAGATIDLSQLCGSNVRSESSPTVTTVAQSSNNAGTAFSQNGCYVFDSLGRPCSPVQN